MTVNPKSLANLKPRIKTTKEVKDSLKVRLPIWCKSWLKECNASYKVEVLIEMFLKLILLFDKIKNNYPGYRVNGFTKGMRDLEEVAQLLEKIR